MLKIDAVKDFIDLVKRYRVAEEMAKQEALGRVFVHDWTAKRDGLQIELDDWISLIEDDRIRLTPALTHTHSF